MPGLPHQTVDRLREAIQTRRYAQGKTHNFYFYPARFPPDVARSVIESLSEPGEWILDPFMGGGTSVVEGLALGRRVVGTDINSLAAFVANVRTTPLSIDDERELLGWADECAQLIPGLRRAALDCAPGVANLPDAVRMFVVGATRIGEDLLSFPRQRDFARCALLRLGQLALDCRDFEAPRRKRLATTFPGLVRSMLEGLTEFVDACSMSGVAKNQITGRRLLLHRSAVGIETDRDIVRAGARPRLVFTSPPYPAVHVLYHRWQYRGRKETSAPYWIADLPDGHGGAYYTAGSRTPTGLRNYFATITAAFRGVRELIAEDGIVAQLVGFSDVTSQLPLYLAAMETAGFEEASIQGVTAQRLRRQVPNRKWYAKLQTKAEASSELLLLHSPRRAARRVPAAHPTQLLS